MLEHLFQVIIGIIKQKFPLYSEEIAYYVRQRAKDIKIKKDLWKDVDFGESCLC